MKLLILTTEPRSLRWRTLDDKLAFIKDALNSGKNAEFEVEMRVAKATPKVVKGRIDRTWLEEHNEPYFSQGYDIIGFHMSRKQWRDLGLIESLRGSNPRDNKSQEDFYFSSDEKNKRKGEDRFTQVCLHETAHAYYQETGFTDLTHQWHDRNSDISGLFKLFDWSKYQPERMRLRKKVSLLQRVLELIGLKNALESNNEPLTLHPRLPDPYNDAISQDYGVKNSAYTLTGRHIGIDYACPVGTEIYAPADGKITVNGTHGSLGKFCYFEYEWEGRKRVERLLHQSNTASKGFYRRGDIIGYTGNTGFSTGPHLHVDGWWDEINTGVINRSNWKDLTYNPHIG